MKRFLYLGIVLIMAAAPCFAVQNAEEDSLREAREQVRLYYNTNKIDECLNELSKIPDSQKSAQEWVLMANIAQDRDKPIDSTLYLQKAIIKDPKFYKSYYNLGNMYFENGSIKLATDNYKKAVSLKKDFAYGYFNLGSCYLQKKNYRLARYYIATAIKYYPEEPLFYYNLAFAYKNLKNEKRAAEVLSTYEELMNR